MNFKDTQQLTEGSAGTVTYHEFFSKMPSNAMIVLPNKQKLSPKEYMIQFQSYTNLDPKKTPIVGSVFTIEFN